MLDLSCMKTPHQCRVIPDRQTYVYFIGEPVTKSIKIGRSSKPTKRIKAIQTEFKQYAALLNKKIGKLELIAVIPESVVFSEDLCHEVFKDTHIIGEWFRPSPLMHKFLLNLTYYFKEVPHFYNDTIRGILDACITNTPDLPSSGNNWSKHLKTINTSKELMNAKGYMDSFPKTLPNLHFMD